MVRVGRVAIGVHDMQDAPTIIEKEAEAIFQA